VGVSRNYKEMLRRRLQTGGPWAESIPHSGFIWPKSMQNVLNYLLGFKTQVIEKLRFGAFLDK
jgi:hypothetical protein